MADQASVVPICAMPPPCSDLTEACAEDTSPFVGLPEHLVWLIYAYLDLGNVSNRKDIFALLASCKTLKAALAHFPADLRLRGTWTDEQLAGLCRAMPQMIRLEPATTPFGYATSATKVSTIQPFLGCTALRTLDLGYVLADYGGWDGRVEEGVGLPKGLTSLGLPCCKLPQGVHEMVDALPSLIDLDCNQTSYYPSTKLTGLQYLMVGGSAPTAFVSFYNNVLPRLDRLISLYLDLPDGLGAETLKPSQLQTFQSLPKLTSLSIFNHCNTLDLMLAVLSSFTGLTGLRYLSLNHRFMPEEGCLDDLLRLIFTSKHRDTRYTGGECEPPGLKASFLTHLKYGAHAYPACGRLATRDVLAMSTFRYLKVLELSHWKVWDDLAPLRQLPLETLGCTNTCMLYDLLAPGALHTLKSITFPYAYSWLGPHETWIAEWMANRKQKPTMQAVRARVASLLLKLPRLSTMGCEYYDTTAELSQGTRKRFESEIHKIVAVEPGTWAACLRKQDDNYMIFKRLR